MEFDFWYGDTVAEVTSISCFFNDLDCEYRGNMYRKDGKCIGDFSATDSLEIEKYFKGVFD